MKFTSTILLTATTALRVNNDPAKSVTLDELHKDAEEAMTAIKDMDKKSEDQIRVEFVQNLFKKKDVVDRYVAENSE